MRACSGVWVAHGSGSADRETVDSKDRVRGAARRGAPTCCGASGSPRRKRRLLLRLLQRRPLAALPRRPRAAGVPRRGLGRTTSAVNQRFADAVCEEVDSDDPIVLVQDYHFALAPRMIRERLPRATIITFWHIPWPNAERFGICPWREELLDGLLGSEHRRLPHPAPLQQLPRLASIASSRRASIARRTRSSRAAARTLVRPYPISIEWPVRWLDDAAAGRRVPGRACAGAGLAARRAARRRRRSPRLHQGHRGAAAGGRAAARALPGVPRALHLRAAGRAQPHRDRALPRAQRERRARSPTRINARFGTARLSARSSCCARTTSRRRCSATIAPRTSAT